MSVTAQVGGDHYKASTQHWDLMEDYDIGYLEGNATKYLMRYDRKGDALNDLKKAKSYLERLLESRTVVRRRVTLKHLQEFFAENGLNESKRQILKLVLHDGYRKHLELAVQLIDKLIEVNQ